MFIKFKNTKNKEKQQKNVWIEIFQIVCFALKKKSEKEKKKKKGQTESYFDCDYFELKFAIVWAGTTFNRRRIASIYLIV